MNLCYDKNGPFLTTFCILLLVTKLKWEVLLFQEIPWNSSQFSVPFLGHIFSNVSPFWTILDHFGPYLIISWSIMWQKSLILASINGFCSLVCFKKCLTLVLLLLLPHTSSTSTPFICEFTLVFYNFTNSSYGSFSPNKWAKIKLLKR